MTTGLPLDLPPFLPILINNNKLIINGLIITLIIIFHHHFFLSRVLFQGLSFRSLEYQQRCPLPQYFPATTPILLHWKGFLRSTCQVQRWCISRDRKWPYKWGFGRYPRILKTLGCKQRETRTWPIRQRVPLPESKRWTRICTGWLMKCGTPRVFSRGLVPGIAHRNHSKYLPSLQKSRSPHLSS